MKPRYIPEPILTAFHNYERSKKFVSSVLSIDISGFTSMCESLLPNGRSGMEILASELEAIFSPMIRTIESRGGFIADYAGDALIALFPEKRGMKHENLTYLAIAAAEDCLAWIKKNELRQTQAGTFKIGIRAGVSFGEAEFYIIERALGHQISNYFGYFFCGDVIEKSAIAQNDAPPGEIKLSADAPSPKSCIAVVSKEFVEPTDADLRLFLHNILIDSIPRGEARRIVSVFGRFSDKLTTDELKKVFALLLEGESAFEGYLSGIHFDSKGWGFLMIFGAPNAHEDDICRALEFAFYMKGRISEFLMNNVKFGINVGEAYSGLIGGAGRVKYTCMGDTVNLAERLSELALPGQILCSSDITQFAEGFEFTDRGTTNIRGKSEYVHIFELLTHRLERTKYISCVRFCGRENELKKVRELIAPIFRGKFSGIIRVIGSAGVGKSRIVYELRKNLEEEGKNFNWVFLPCDSINKSPFNPLIQFLKSRFPYEEFGNKEELKNRFHWEFEEYARNPLISDENRNEILRTVSILGGYLGYHWNNSLSEGIDANARKENFLYAMKSLIKAESEIAPTIIELEDSHWLDAETKAWLAILMRNVGNSPFVIITTERPNEKGEICEFEFSYRVLENRVYLKNLSPDGFIELATSLLGSPPDEKLLDYLQKHTDGNPFFIEQFCRHFIATGAVKESDGAMRLVFSPEQLPPNAEAMLVARIDAMGVRVKELLQRASVIGMRFAMTILEKVIEQPMDIQSSLSDAERNGAICLDDLAELSELYYLFRHALLHETAYNMQLPGVRAKIHKLILEIYEQLYPEKERGNYYLEMSRHAEKIGGAAKFYDYLSRAADYAREKYNNEQAIELYDKMLLQEFSQKNRADTILKKGIVLSHIGKINEALEISHRALKFYEELDDIEGRAQAISRIGNLQMSLGNFEKSLEVFNEALILWRNLNNRNSEADALNNIGNVFYELGDYEKAMEYYQTVLKIYKEIEDRNSEGKTINNIGLIFCRKGDYDKAMEYFNEDLLICRESNDIVGEGQVLANIGGVFARKGDNEKAIEYYDKDLAICRKVGDKQGEAITLGNIGVIYNNMHDYKKAMEYSELAKAISNEIGDKANEAQIISTIGLLYQKSGEYEKAMEYHNLSLNMWRELGSKGGISFALTNLAKVYVSINERSKAIELFKQAIELMEAVGEKYYLSLMYSYLAETLFEEGLLDESQDVLNKAVELANDIDLPGVKFTGAVLSIKIINVRGKAEEALEKFRQMLSSAHEDHEKALLNYEIWKILPIGPQKTEFWKTALELYEQLYKSIGDIDYLEKINELRNAAPP